MPARSPLYGWDGFGPAPRLVDGIVELPVTLLPLRPLPLPIGGVYFRVLPRPLLRWALGRRRDRGEPVLSYHHPYDIDTEQSFMLVEIDGDVLRFQTISRRGKRVDSGEIRLGASS